MQCAKCGTQNRSDARFCKQCGAPLAAVLVETPKPVSGIDADVCTSCGATLRLNARFCARCGQPVVASKASSASLLASQVGRDVGARAVPLDDTTWEPSNDVRVEQTSVSVSPRTSDYAAPGYAPMPSSPPSTNAKRGIPRWLWFVVGAVLIIFVAVIAARVLLLFNPLDGDDSTDASAPLVVTISTEELVLTVSSNPITVGEQLEVSVAFTNTQDVAVQSVRVYLDETGQSALTPVGETTISIDDRAIAPSASETWTFTLDAASVGDASIAASVSAELATDPPSPDLWRIGPLTITVEP